MDFSFSEEQQLLQNSVQKFVNNSYGFEARRQWIHSDLGYSKENWQLFAELGWLLIPFKESDGGMGADTADLMILMEEFGKGMVIEPYVATLVLCGGLLSEMGSEPQKTELLTRLMNGTLQMALAYVEADSRYDLERVNTIAETQADGYVLNGSKSVVLNGHCADKLLVTARTSGKPNERDGVSVFVVDSDTAGISKKAYRTVDGFHAAEIDFNQVTVPKTAMIGLEGTAVTALERVIDRATIAVCAEAVGIVEVLIHKTLEYTKTRVQFGVPIASFQALQHRMVDMFIEHQQAKSILMMAVMAMQSGHDGVSKAVSAAKSRIGHAARKVGQEAVQLHGGIGVSDELDIGHYFKRLTMIRLMFGDSDYHTQKFMRC